MRMRRSELFLPLRFFFFFVLLLLLLLPLLLFFAGNADGDCGDATELFMRQLRPAPLPLLLLCIVLFDGRRVRE